MWVALGVNSGTLGRKKSVCWLKGRYVELLHKLTLGLGSFLQ